MQGDVDYPQQIHLFYFQFFCLFPLLLQKRFVVNKFFIINAKFEGIVSNYMILQLIAHWHLHCVNKDLNMKILSLRCFACLWRCAISAGCITCQYQFIIDHIRYHSADHLPMFSDEIVAGFQRSRANRYSSSFKSISNIHQSAVNEYPLVGVSSSTYFITAINYTKANMLNKRFMVFYENFRPITFGRKPV